MSDAIRRFELSVPQRELDALMIQLERTRWPERETVGDWSQGVPIEAMKALVRHWRHDYDWRRCEAALNGWGQYKTEIDGLDIHFLHVRSPEAGALPVVMTHGWPGSIIEFNKVIGPLTDPVAHGGAREDAFHLVIPSLPGYGFSDKPKSPGWKVERIGAAWIELMRRLGYKRWAAQGGDWGAAVTAVIGHSAPPDLVGIHLNMPFPAGPPRGARVEEFTAEERRHLEALQRYDAELSGYSKEQSTRPQTIGYSLVDSPAGLAAWIYEKFHDWTDHDGAPETILSRDEILDNIMLYWLPATGASAARLYWESMNHLPNKPIEVPVGLSVFPRELFGVSRRWAEASYSKLVHFGTPPKGGHFAAFEQPALFVEELRRSFAALRS